jgi:chromosome segregation ATPase
LASDLEQATEAIKYLGQKLSGSQLSFSAQTNFPDAFKQVENVAEHLLRDCEEQRHTNAMLSDSLEKQERLVSDLQQERQRLELQLGQTQGHLAEIQAALGEKNNEIERLQEMAQNYQSRASEAYERELPKLKAEIEHLKEKLAQTTHDLDRSMQELVMTQQAAEDFKRRWEASESQALEAGSAIADRAAQINQLQQARNDLVKKLSASEEMGKSLNKRLEEMKGQLEHAEKVKIAVEEGFSRQIKSLHSANTELKLQLAANSNGTSDANARLERLNATVESLRAEKESLFARLQAKEHNLGSIQQDLDTLRSEKKSLESDLQLRHEYAHTDFLCPVILF